MNHSVKQIVSLLLILLLAISPMLPTHADWSVPQETQKMPCHMEQNTLTTDSVADKMTVNCDMCEKSIPCDGIGSTSAQNTSNGLALFHTISTASQVFKEPIVTDSFSQFNSHQSPALFRPPRV